MTNKTNKKTGANGLTDAPTIETAQIEVISVTETSPRYERTTTEAQKIGYVQGLYGDALDTAILHLKNDGVDIIFHEKRAFESTKLTYRAFMDYLRKGDEVVVYQLVNFAKNVVYLEQEASKVVGLGASMRSISEPWFVLTTETEATTWIILHGLATMEKQGRAELQKYSLAKTQKAGHHQKSGRKVEIEAIENAIADYLNNEDDTPVSHIARKHGISRATLYRYLKDRGLYKSKF